MAERFGELPSPTRPLPLVPLDSEPLGVADSTTATGPGSIDEADSTTKDHQRITLLRVARDAFVLLAGSGLCSSDASSDFFCAPKLWRNAGVIW